MRKNKYIKKAAKGLQSVAVPEGGSDSSVLSSASTMASAGSQFGPWGAAIGGVLGLGAGLLQKKSMDRANRLATEKNTYLTANRAVDGVDDSLDQKTQRLRKGTKNASSKVIEIEGKTTPEIHTDKNFNVKNLGTTPHSKGGDKVMASEGDIVFNTQNSLSKFNKIASAIEEGDHKTLHKEKNKLPEDSGTKAQDGKRVKTKNTKDYAVEEMEKEAQGLPSTVNPVAKRALKSVVKTLPKSSSSTKPILDRFMDYQYQNWGGKPNSDATNKVKRAIDYQVEGWTGNRPMGTSDKTTTNLLAPSTNKEGYMPAPFRTKDFNGGMVAPSIPAFVPGSGKGKPNPVGKKGRNISTKSVTPASPIPTVKPFEYGVSVNPELSTLVAPKEATKPFEFAKESLLDANGNVKPTTPAVNTSAGKFASTANNVAQFTGVANNLFNGLKNTTPTPEQYFDPQLIKYNDRSESLRQLSNGAVTTQTSNARNVSGGSASNIRANQNAASLGNLTRQNSIDEQEMGRRDAIEAQNIGLKNQAGQYNLQRKDMYQGQMDAKNNLKQQYMDQAAADIGQYGMAKQEESYMRSKDDKMSAAQLAGLKAIGTRDFNRDVDGNKIFNESESTGTIGGFTFPTATKSKGRGTTMRRTPGFNNAQGNRSVKVSKYKKK